MKLNLTKLFIIASITALPVSFVYAALSCSVTTSALCTGTVLLRMSSSSNAHAELPSQATTVYDNNVVCCSGPVGLSNSCSLTNNETIVKLSGVTNAHVEENTQSNYANNACISSSFAGDVITIGYQPTNCTGYDTTLFSMASTPTNSQVGNTSAYSNKVCGTIFSQSISFSISDNSIGFGSLSSSDLSYATGDGLGSATEVEAFNMTVNTNAPYGYSLGMQGATLTSGANTIDAIGGVNTVISAGTEGFGLRAVATGGSGAVSIPYSASGFAYDAVSARDELAAASTGDEVTTTYSVRGVASTSPVTAPGNYSTNITFVVTARF